MSWDDLAISERRPRAASVRLPVCRAQRVALSRMTKEAKLLNSRLTSALVLAVERSIRLAMMCLTIKAEGQQDEAREPHWTRVDLDGVARAAN
jgi:hypothetical protein